MQLRILLVTLLGTALAIVPLPASAKGPTEVVITGPGLEEPIRLDQEAMDASSMRVLMEVVYDRPAYRAAPSVRLGPRYRATFTMTDSNGDETIRKSLYPFADGGPLVGTPPGQMLYGEEQASGWQHAPATLDSLLVSLGAPAPVGADLEWLKYEDYEHGLSISYPPAWYAATSRVAPSLVDPVIPVAIGTYAVPTRGCGMAPGGALEALGRKDAFIAIYVGTGAVFQATGFERPPHFGPELPWRTGPGKCAENVKGTIRTLHFEVGDRRLMAMVATGPEVSPEREQTVYRILDTLTVEPPSVPPALAG